MWSAAEFVLGSFEIQQLICGKFYVTDVDIVFTVFYKKENLRCTCQQCAKTDGLYPHVVVVAEKEGLFETFISSCIDTGGNIKNVQQCTRKCRR